MDKQATDTVRLRPENLDEIRASIDWQKMFAALGLREAPNKSKPNDKWAYSPFHDENTPSFHMGPLGLWFDFSIGEGGGAIELVQRIYGLNCYEAGHLILENGWANASINLRKPVTKTRDSVRRGVTSAVTGGADAEPPANDPIRQDLLKLCEYHPAIEARGISEATCTLLGIGYLPQGRSPLKGRVVFQVADARVTKKSEGNHTRVILSHLGRAISDETDPKYLFYQGFHKSAELHAQEILLLHEDAVEQARSTGSILLTEGPFDVAKAVESGFRNVVGSFGAALSKAQASKLAAMARELGADRICIAYDRDEAGQDGAVKATEKLTALGLKVEVFDWNAAMARGPQGDVFIPDEVQDLADFSTKQLQWLRQRGWL